MTGDESGSATRVQALRARLAPHEEKLRFLVVGVWNTVFSMAVLWAAERLIPYGPGSVLAGAVGVIAAKQTVLVLAWVIAVTQNLFSFKLLVFRTKGHWAREYARMYVTYAGTFVVESVMIQVISGSLGWSLAWSKLPTLVVTTVLSYLGHKYFTFRTAAESVAADFEESGDEWRVPLAAEDTPDPEPTGHPEGLDDDPARDL